MAGQHRLCAGGYVFGDQKALRKRDRERPEAAASCGSTSLSLVLLAAIRIPLRRDGVGFGLPPQRNL
jgi:hypothetical protein